jgi:hypothetical protein
LVVLVGERGAAARVFSLSFMSGFRTSLD